MTKPATIERYFACVGAQKAGTTWLARVLERHPDIFVTPVKEIHYFDHIAGLTEHLSDRKRRSRYRKFHQRMWTQPARWKHHRAQRDWYRAYMQPRLDDDWYASLFSARQNKAVAGEATPEYALIGKAGLRHIKQLAPDARLIYILRNPVTRAWSQLLHQCRSRQLDADSMSTDAFLALAGEDRFEALADYEAVLADLDSEFAREQVLLSFYEEIHSDRAAALETVCGFLRVPFNADHFSDLEARYNISQPARLTEELRQELRRKYLRLSETVASRLGRLPPDWEEEFRALSG